MMKTNHHIAEQQRIMVLIIGLKTLLQTHLIQIISPIKLVMVSLAEVSGFLVGVTMKNNITQVVKMVILKNVMLQPIQQKILLLKMVI